LGPGRRHDVGGVTGEEQPSETHRLGDEAAQRRDALFERRTGHQALARLLVEACLQRFPEALVRPSLDLLGEASWKVIAAARRRANGAEREAKVMAHIDQLLRHRRRVGEEAEPAERIDPLELADRLRRHALARDAVEAIAAGDEVARDLALLTSL